LGSLVSILTRLWADEFRVQFTLLTVQTSCGTNPTYSMHDKVLCPGVKRSGHEVDRSPPSAKVKNEWSNTSSPCICLHGVHRDNFILSFDTLRIVQNKYIPCVENRGFLMLGQVAHTVATGI
jgi:hypothetical protein